MCIYMIHILNLENRCAHILWIYYATYLIGLCTGWPIDYRRHALDNNVSFPSLIVDRGTEVKSMLCGLFEDSHVVKST